MNYIAGDKPTQDEIFAETVRNSAPHIVKLYEEAQFEYARAEHHYYETKTEDSEVNLRAAKKKLQKATMVLGGYLHDPKQAAKPVPEDHIQSVMDILTALAESKAQEVLIKNIANRDTSYSLAF